MAIDTENKRRSALGRSILPRPDGTIDQADRQHKVWKYAGILAGAPVTTTVLGMEWTFPSNHLDFEFPANPLHFEAPANHFDFEFSEED